MNDGEQDVFIPPWWLLHSIVMVWVGLLALAVIASISAVRYFYHG